MCSNIFNLKLANISNLELVNNIKPVYISILLYLWIELMASRELNVLYEVMSYSSILGLSSAEIYNGSLESLMYTIRKN